MRKQCEGSRYDTTIEIKTLNGSRQLPPKLSDGTLRTGSLPGSFGRKDRRSRSYYRSHWESDDALGPPTPLTCLQVAEPSSMKGSTITLEKKKERKPQRPSSKTQCRIMCSILTWVALIGLLGFTVWLYVKLDRLRSEKDRLQTTVDGDTDTLVTLKLRTETLTDQRKSLEARLRDGICDIEILQNVTQQLKNKLDVVSRQLVDRDQRLRTVEDRLSSLQGCDDCLLRDCSDVRAQNSLNGVYPVWPKNFTNAFYVYCDMTTSGGGWTVIQQRLDGTVDFFRNWTEYKTGFGDLNGEFWIGNDNLYLLTSQNDYKLRVDLEDWEGNKVYAEYSSFTVSSEDDNYRLRLGSYTGNAGDSMTALNSSQDMNLTDAQFSTKDRDNESSSKNCAFLFKGGWWYNDCFQANLNGKYYRQSNYNSNVPDGIIWWSLKKSYNYSLKRVSMKIRPMIFIP